MKKLLAILFFVAIAANSFGQSCQALFTYYNSPATVMLVDNSVNTDSSQIDITSWVWTVSFGGSMQTYTTQNPTFPLNGYTGSIVVCLSITTTTSCFSQFCDTITIANTADTCVAGFYHQHPSDSLYTGNNTFYDQSYTYNGTINSWTWVVSYNGSTIATSNVQHPTFALLTPGAYDVCLTIGSDSGCQANYCETIAVQDSVILGCMPTVSALINQVTTIGGNDGSIDLTVSGGTPPYSFDWSTGATTEDITNLTSGVYSVNISTIPACPVYSYTYYILEPFDSLNFIVDTLYTTTVDTCFGFPVDSFYISNISVSGYTVTVVWIFTGGGLTFTQVVTYTYDIYGTQVVVLSVGCNGTKNLTTYMSYIHINAPSGMETLNLGEDIALYPNPVKDYLQLDFGNQSADAWSVAIFSASGQQVFAQKFAAATNSVEINVRNLAAGIYFMKLDNGNGKPLVKKIIK
ncbi:MAG: T9SS type A sorting domain-containing protein [Bacteroidota bacterium]